jgi:cell division protein FtsN
VSVTSPKTLSRDFKHVKRHAPGGVMAVNGWIGFGIGLSVGLAVALAVHLHHYRDQAAADVPQPAAEAPPASSTAPTVEPPQATDAAAAYDFYDMLPKQEVEVPGIGEKGANPAARSALPQGDVTLQAGSFKQPDEADKLQARLAQYGVDSKIQRFSLDDETWYRVRIGPIATVEQLDSIRAKLAEAEIDATPVSASSEPPPP